MQQINHYTIAKKQDCILCVCVEFQAFFHARFHRKNERNPVHSFHGLVHSFLRRCWFISKVLRLFRKIFAFFASYSAIIFDGLALGWYDDAGRLISESNCASSQYFSKTEYTYDCRGRILSASVKNRSNDIISLKTFAYTISTIDGIIYCKNTKTIIGGSSSPSIVTFEYIDKMGRVVRSGNIHNGNEIYKTFLYNISDKTPHKISGNIIFAMI